MRPSCGGSGGRAAQRPPALADEQQRPERDARARRLRKYRVGVVVLTFGWAAGFIAALVLVFIAAIVSVYRLTLGGVGDFVLGVGLSWCGTSHSVCSSTLPTERCSRWRDFHAQFAGSNGRAGTGVWALRAQGRFSRCSDPDTSREHSFMS